MSSLRSNGQNVRIRHHVVKLSIKILLLCSLQTLWLRYCRWSFLSCKLLIKSSWIWGLYGEGYKVCEETNKEELVGDIKVRTTLATVTMRLAESRSLGGDSRAKSHTNPGLQERRTSACLRMCLDEFHKRSCWKQKRSKRDDWFARMTSSMLNKRLSQWTVNQKQPEVFINEQGALDRIQIKKKKV